MPHTTVRAVGARVGGGHVEWHMHGPAWRPGHSAATYRQGARSQTMTRDMKDSATVIRSILREADELICRRRKESRLNVSHILAGVTPDRKVVLHTNVSPDVLRWFGEDLKNIAQDITAAPKPDATVASKLGDPNAPKPGGPTH